MEPAPRKSDVGALDEAVVNGGDTGVGVVVVWGWPRPKPGVTPVSGGSDGWTGTPVGKDKLVSGIEAKSDDRKFRPSMATGISDDTVNSSGVEKGPGGVTKNSLRNCEKWPKGPS